MTILNQYSIYLITNMVNGKQYAGQTKQTVRRRWQGHLCDARRNKNTVICWAINKHGSDAFRVSVLRSGLSKSQADHEESLAIRSLNLTDRSFGYNLTSGGEGTVFTEEARNNMRMNSGQKRHDVSDEFISNLYRQGKTTIEIAEEVGMTFQGIGWRLKNLGMQLRKGKNLPDQDILERFQKGESAEKIGNSLSVDGDAIIRRLKKAGILVKPGNTYKKHLPDEVASLYLSGWTSQEVGAKFGMTSVNIRRRLRQMGVKMRGRGKGRVNSENPKAA